MEAEGQLNGGLGAEPPGTWIHMGPGQRKHAKKTKNIFDLGPVIGEPL